MPTNKPGYTRLFFHAERAKIIKELIQRGSCCEHAEEEGCYGVEIHHVRGLSGNRPNGQLDRLYEWKRNMNNLEALCIDCHRKEHTGKEWFER